jgi:hypothetical protein
MGGGREILQGTIPAVAWMTEETTETWIGMMGLQVQNESSDLMITKRDWYTLN